MPDRLRLQGVTAECRLGVYEWEQASAQTVWLDAEVEIDAARGAKHDDVRDAVDYAKLVTRLKSVARQRPYRLLETMAEDLASALLHETGSPRVRVRVTKRALPGIDAASVEVERGAAQRRRGRARTAAR